MRLFALAFLVGVSCLQRLAELPERPAAWVALALAIALARSLASPRRALGRVLPAGSRSLARGVLLVACGLLAGFGYAAWRAQVALAAALPPSLEGVDLAVIGVVAGLPQETPAGTRFPFAIEDWPGRGEVASLPELISVTWYAPRAGAAAPLPPRIVPGDRWRFTVRLKAARGLANPHGFDFEAWALERGLRATGYVREGERAAPPHAEGWPWTLHRWRFEVRDRMRQQLGDSPLGGVLVALAIGDQDAIAEADWDTFWRTGVGHLMSISGLHITMLAALGFLVAHFVWARVPALALRLPARKAAVVAGVLVALGYTLMTGYAVPAQRTLLMLTVFALCVLAERHGSPSRVLALAALGVLGLDPWAVLAPGFWLSFGAVASIFYALALRTRGAGKLQAAIAEQLAVTIVMLPLMMALFQQASVVAPLANAVAIPVVSLAVAPLAIAGAFLPVPGLLVLAHTLMAALMQPLEWLAALPWATIERASPPPWATASALVGALWLLAPRGVPLRVCGLVWLAPLFVLPPPGPAPGEAWVDVLDVGNGLAVVVRTADHVLVYDTGPSWLGEADAGGRIVVPFLRGEGVRRLDGLVVSHADDDHSGGAASIAFERDPAWMLSSLPEDSPLHDLVAPSWHCFAGQSWTWDGVAFTVLHPGGEIYGSEPRKRKENDRGCVLRVATSARSMLLAADVEARGEAEMLARDPLALGSDVLLVPHHGSKTSSTPAYLDAIAPAVAIISAGYRNRFHHPHPAVVERYRAQGVEPRLTFAEGAMHVALPARPGEAVVVTNQRAACRYWSTREDCVTSRAAP